MAFNSADDCGWYFTVFISCGLTGFSWCCCFSMKWLFLAVILWLVVAAYCFLACCGHHHVVPFVLVFMVRILHRETRTARELNVEMWSHEKILCAQTVIIYTYICAKGEHGIRNGINHKLYHAVLVNKAFQKPFSELPSSTSWLSTHFFNGSPFLHLWFFHFSNCI